MSSLQSLHKISILYEHIKYKIYRGLNRFVNYINLDTISIPVISNVDGVRVIEIYL